MAATGNPELNEDKRFTLEFIRAYRDLPALWAVGDLPFFDKMKSEAYATLLLKYQEKQPGAKKGDVENVINGLRNLFRTELYLLKKNRSHVRTQYFEAIAFLTGFMKPRKPRNKNVQAFDSSQYEQLFLEPEGSNGATKVGDECRRVARVWAADLAMANQEQQMFAKTAIFKILGAAQRGTLDDDSVQINNKKQNNPGQN